MSTLKPAKYNDLDFFVADIFNITSFSGDLLSMEHPFFALKQGDTSVIEYNHNNVNIIIRPAAEIGRANIFDKDVWIYCISKLMQAKFEKKELSRKVRFTTYDFLVTTNRDTGGRTYKELEKSLERLGGTRITTNLKTNDTSETNSFGLIEHWKVVETIKGTKKLDMIEVTLPDWLYTSIEELNVLKIHHDYFRIRKAIYRRIYEIARKHCGNQDTFKINLELLHLKTGSTSSKAEFRRALKGLSEKNDLPGYEVIYDANEDNVYFYNKDNRKLKLPSRPKVIKGSHLEGEWAKKCIELIREHEKKGFELTEKELNLLCRFYKITGDDFSLTSCLERLEKEKLK